MLVMLVRVHHRESVPEAFEGTRERHGAGNEGELRCVRRGQIVGSRSEQTHEKASRRPILLLRHLHLSHGTVKKGNIFPRHKRKLRYWERRRV